MRRAGLSGIFFAAQIAASRHIYQSSIKKANTSAPSNSLVPYLDGNNEPPVYRDNGTARERHPEGREKGGDRQSREMDFRARGREYRPEIHT